MKSYPFYRRGNSSTGITERIVHSLLKEPKFHSELCILIGISPSELNRHILSMLKVKAMYRIAAGEWFKNERGEKERLYKLLELNGKKTKPNASPYFCPKGKANHSEERKKKYSLMAKARAKLIAAGIYNQKMESELCTIFGLD